MIKMPKRQVLSISDRLLLNICPIHSEPYSHKDYTQIKIEHKSIK